MPHDEKRIFVSRNKRKKEALLLTIYFSVTIILTGIILQDPEEITIFILAANIIIIANIPPIIRSLKYKDIRAEINSRQCEIYAGAKLLARIDVASMSYSSYGRGGLRLKFASSMSIRARVQLASLFLHFFGFCIDRAVLPNGLFPSISEVARK